MVLGPSGTGKSVLIKHIVGLLYPDSGDVLVHGESIPNMTDDELFEVRKKFGLLFQDGALFGSMNIYDNIAFPLRQHTDKSEEEIGEIVNRRLQRGRPHRGDLQDAERALRRDAQARRLRPGAGAGTGDRDVRRARLRPRPGAHGAALRADPRGPRRERRLLPGDQPRPRHRAPDRRLHRGALERQDRRVGPERGAVRLRATRSSASSSTRTSAARSRWTEVGRAGSVRARRGLGGAARPPAARGQRRAGDRRRDRRDPAADRRRGRHPGRLRHRRPTEATQQVREDFGEEPVVVLAKGDLPKLLLTDNLFRLLRLEGCLSGKVPKGAKPIPGPCAELAELEAVEFLAGPATFLNEAVVQIDDQLRRLAEHVPPPTASANTCSRSPTKYGITSAPEHRQRRIRRHRRLRPRRAARARRRRGSPISSPTRSSAQIVIRLKPDLSEAERHRAIGLIEAAVEDTTPRQACKEDGKPAPCFELEGRQLRRLRRAGRRRRRLASAEGRPAAPLRGRGRGHGPRPAPRLPLPLAAAAARRSPSRRRRSPSACSAWSAAR